MKRFIVLLIILCLSVACIATRENRYTSNVFDADLPEHFTRVANTDIVCFAPYGNPLHSSSITYYETELNWYFDSFTSSEYENALRELCGFETLTFVDLQTCRVDSYDARRISCSVEIDQGIHSLIIYAIQGQKTYFFTLLNRDSDSYIDAFDEMMKTIDLKETQL